MAALPDKDLVHGQITTLSVLHPGQKGQIVQQGLLLGLGQEKCLLGLLPALRLKAGPTGPGQ